ncbi:hypothetical protein V3C99_004473 [Haemonchus contortus]
MSDLGTWFRSVPIVTRYWFAISVVLPLLGRFGLINPMWMYLDWDLVVYRFHFWRPITALLFYPVSPQTGFHWLLMLYFLYNYSKNLETGVFSGRPADYLYMLIFNWLVCTGICMAAGVYFLLEPMVLSVLYVWCQLNKDTIVSFWFGTTFKVSHVSSLDSMCFQCRPSWRWYERTAWNSRRTYLLLPSFRLSITAWWSIFPANTTIFIQFSP